MKSPVNWIGKKENFLQEIFEFFPKTIENYVEPFLGSGSVFLSMKDHGIRVQRAHLNDFNKNIFNFFKIWFDPEKKEELVGKLIEIPLYKDLQNEIIQTSEDEALKVACWLLALKTRQFSAFSGCQQINGQFKKKSLISVIRGVVDDFSFCSIFNMDALSFLKTHLTKSKVLKNPFIYLDPPYATNSKMYGLKSFDVAPILDFLDEERVPYILSEYSKNDALKERFDGRWKLLQGRSKLSQLAKDDNRQEALFFSKEIEFMKKSLF